MIYNINIIHLKLMVGKLFLEIKKPAYAGFFNQAYASLLSFSSITHIGLAMNIEE